MSTKSRRSHLKSAWSDSSSSLWEYPKKSYLLHGVEPVFLDSRALKFLISKIYYLTIFKDAAAADEEASLIHQLEMLEIQEEIDDEENDNEEERDEDVQIIEEEEDIPPPNAPQETQKKKKIQSQITSFFARQK